MKLLTKAFIVVLTVIFSTSFTVAYAEGGDDTPPPTPTANYDQEMQYLRDTINSLSQQLNNVSVETPQPTERPVSLPKVKLMTPTTFSIKNGRTEDITITVKNVGSSYANNVLTQATPSAGAPFTLQFLNNSNSSYSIYEGSTKNITAKITVDKNAKAGSYPITLTHSYRNDKNENFSETDTLMIRVENPSSAPNILLRDFKNSLENVTPGKSFTITATMENASTLDASDVQIQLDGLGSDTIYMSGDSGALFYRSYSANYQQYINFSMTAASKIKKGTYPVTFKISFKDSAGAAHDNSYVYYVNIGDTAASDESRPLVTITDMNVPKDTFEVGQELSISMKIVNNGPSDAKNVKITATADADGAVVPKSSSVLMFNSLPEGESSEAVFVFAPTSKSRSQNYAIKFLVEYETGVKTEDDKAEVLTFEQYAGINVFNPDEEDKPEASPKISKPKIIISSYESDPIIAAAGQEFDLRLEFQNTHPTKSVENIKATLTAVETTDKKGSVFTPVHGSNTIFIDKIAPKATVETIMRMYTVPDADPRNYTIKVVFVYQDGDYEEYTEEELIGINVKQVTKFETSDFDVQSESMVGQPVYLWFNIINSGKVALTNLKIEVVGNFDTTNANMYLGSLNKATSAYYDGSFVTNEPGTHEGKIIISCEDDTGEQMEIVKEFTINVTEMPVMEDMGFEDMSQMLPQPTIMDRVMGIVKNPFVWVGAVAAIVVIVLLSRKFIFKKKGMDFDE